MAFTYGFYNAIDDDRLYDAIQMSQLFDGLINDGVYATYGDHYLVRENPSEADSVIVGVGRAWFNHTWNYNDNALIMYGDRSEIMMDRWDAIVIDVDEDERTNQLLWIKGAPGTNPSKPTLVKMLSHNQYPIAYILRKPGTTNIEQRYIQNAVGTSECPFVTGIIQTINTDDLILQWKAEWKALVMDYYNETIKFGDTIRNEMEQFQELQQADFIQWFEQMKDILDESQAGHLQNEIDSIIEKNFYQYYDMINSEVIINDASNTITKTTDDGKVVTRIVELANGNTEVTTQVDITIDVYLYEKKTTIIPISTGSQISTTWKRTIKALIS